MERLFFWLSGADKSILRQCPNLGSSEKIKFCGLGALVLVPATLGMVSMAYAISTVAPSQWAYIPAGIIWGAIVLVIDRYLVSTTNRSTAGLGRGDRTALIARYVFALFVGIAVAHPFVLLWFHSSTAQQIDENRRAAVSTRVQEGDTARAVLTGAAPAPQTALLLQQRQQEVEHQQCLVKLQQYEQSSAPPIQLPCGATTGIPTCAEKCIEITPRIDDAGRNIAALDKQINAARTAEQSSLDQQGHLLDDANNRQAADIESINGNTSTDYLARVEALGQLADKHHEVYIVSLFIIILFVMVDVLPITMKYATAVGEYDEIKETLMLGSREVELAKRQVVMSGSTAKAMAEAEAGAARLMAEIGPLYRVSAQTFEAYTTSRLDLEEKISQLLRSLGENPDPAEVAKVQADIIIMRDLDKQAWKKAFEKLNHHIDNA
jgi:hypothetical protein